MDYIVLISAVIIGAGIAYFFQNNSKFSKRLLMFSAGLLLAITVLDMFPLLFQSGETNAGIWIIIGVGTQLLLEGLSKGIEHGHLHSSNDHTHNVIPLSVMLGLFIHSFLEGTPLEVHHHHMHTHEVHEPHLHSSNILWALSIHKVSETIVLSTFLFSLNIKKIFAVSILILFAVSAPIGAFFGSFLAPNVYPKILGIVAGIFLHISSVIIFESNEKHSLDWQKLLLVFSGMFLGFLIS
ncbi:ZIP family metal transporter [Apibacter sp.]|uniref:ZIP family metal transporter n=1 Tax=Apibacter sp. TaxID=2023709 RepID=UPI0025FC6020|nr:ZIP family metal transporter [Apibacter sp.]MCT6869559.1 ZIP family metal transporter [Apibacter sp.]